MNANILNRVQADKIIASNDASDRRWGITYRGSKSKIVREIYHLLTQVIFSDISEAIAKRIGQLHTHGEDLNYGTLTKLRGHLTRHLND